METCPKVRHMTLEEYQQSYELHLQDKIKNIEELYMEKSINILTAPPFCYSRDRARVVSENVLLKGHILMSNADESDSEEDEANQINDIAVQLRNIYDVSILMVSAPFAKDGRTVEQDTQSRELQYKNYIEMHPELKRPNEKVKVEDVMNVLNYKDMLDKIEDFMKNYGQAVTSSVIFNGHGSPEGLYFQDQQEPTNLDEVVKDVQNIVVDTRNSSFDSLPHQVELIFSQCYAHNHPQPHIDNFKVYCFTSDGGLQVTEVKINHDDLTMDVVDAHHKQLENHVQDQAKTWAQNLSQYEANKVPVGVPITDMDNQEVETMDF